MHSKVREDPALDTLLKVVYQYRVVVHSHSLELIIKLSEANKTLLITEARKACKPQLTRLIATSSRQRTRVRYSSIKLCRSKVETRKW